MLEDDIIETERPSIRMYEKKRNECIEHVLTMRRVLQEESTLRTNEDLDVLDTVIETQQILQQLVLLHFGSLDYETEEARQFESRINDKIQFAKLNKRMLKIKQQKEEAEARRLEEERAAAAAAEAALLEEANREPTPPVKGKKGAKAAAGAKTAKK